MTSLWLLSLMVIACGSAYELDLSNGTLTAVPADLLSNITMLDLSRNQIVTIQKHTFINLMDLTRLYLRNNHISYIEDGAFDGLSNVEILDLRANKLIDIPYISNMPLRYLRMATNPIPWLNTSRFANLPIKLLTLNRMYLDKVGSFPMLTDLAEINLNRNRITKLSHGFLNGFNSLRKLILDHNKLPSLPWIGSASIHIETLDLHQNRFYSVPDLSDYLSLSSLDLSENYISSVLESSMAHMASGTVDLRSNPILCLMELCWLANSPWPFTVELTCPGGTEWSNMPRDLICEGKFKCSEVFPVYDFKGFCWNFRKFLTGTKTMVEMLKLSMCRQANLSQSLLHHILGTGNKTRIKLAQTICIMERIFLHSKFFILIKMIELLTVRRRIY